MKHARLAFWAKILKQIIKYEWTLYLIWPHHQLKYTQTLSAEEVEQKQCYLMGEGFSSL